MVKSNMTSLKNGLMIILLVFYINVNYTYSEKKEPLPPVMCQYLGVKAISDYYMVIADIPERCKTILYSTYHINEGPSAEDIDTIAALKKANKSVYMTLASPSWIEMMTTVKYDTEIELMVAFMKENKISGVLMNIQNLYTTKVTASNINELLPKMKPNGTTFKVGLLIPGHECDKFGNKSLVDYKSTNALMDIYVIDSASAGVPCDEKSSKTGRLPKSNSNQCASLDSISKRTAGSGMDVEKVMISFSIRVTTVINTKTDSITYAKVQFVKPSFKGIVLNLLNNDAYDKSCGDCGKFPVANAYIDGWETKTITCVVN